MSKHLGNQQATGSIDAGGSTTPATPPKPAPMRVLDTTAQPAEGNPTGKRVHSQLIDGQIKQYEFLPGVGVDMPQAVALKFLKHDAFVLVDADNNPLPYDRTPKQPEELGAGETFKMAENETIARLDELTNSALLKRVLGMLGGEKFAENPDRAAIIAHIIAGKKTLAIANKSKVRDVKADEFVPDADLDEVA